MLPLILGGAAVWGWHWWKKRHASPALLTPARAALHGEILRHEVDPNKLDRMAHLFGAEGLTVQANQLAGKAREVRKQAAGARELIDRARTGDQNAMGLIAGVREAALAGSPRAQASCKLMLKYCELYPMQELGPLGEHPTADPGQAFQQAVAHGHITSPFGCGP
jgi:hypothetical protein